MGTLTVYLDNCCYYRLFDDDTQPKIRAEAAKIRDIIRHRLDGKYIIIGSGFVVEEMGKTRDAALRIAVEALYNRTIAGSVETSAQYIERALYLERYGLGAMDAQHLATAEGAGADFLLTVDKDFIRICTEKKLTTVKVINPLNWRV